MWEFRTHKCHMQIILCWTNQSSLKQRYQEDILFIKQTYPQSAYAVYILYNNHAYEPITIMSLLKQATKAEFLQNNFTPIHTVIIKSSYRNKMKAKTTQCTN